MATPFQMQVQQKKFWCWAAVAASVDAFYAAPPAAAWTQCSVVAQTLPVATCCVNPAAEKSCDRPMRLELGLQTVGRLRSFVNRPLSFAELREEIDARRPVCARVGWAGGAGHAVVLSGYGFLTKSGRPVVLVKDPYFKASVMDFEDFCTDYQGRGVWTHTFLLEAGGEA